MPTGPSPLSALETAALRAIAANYPEQEQQLLASFNACAAANRQNTGGGFFTDLVAAVPVGRLDGIHSPLGDAWFIVEGMRFGICCLVFLADGSPTLLEGYAPAREDTSPIDFATARFRKRDGPPTGEDGPFDEP